MQVKMRKRIPIALNIGEPSQKAMAKKLGTKFLLQKDEPAEK